MRITTRFTAKSALAITLLWVAALALTGATEALLFLAPALLIVIPLLGGRYIGEELIARLVERCTRKAARSTAPVAPALPAAAPTWRIRGTRLIAFSLAKRPPPALAFSLS
ncbi:MAG TPA: hypothetical protein VFX45_06835 [Solirubrobacterales bacterium]|nr:hypothetical protein [Solirubrobacterales bacterium]